MRGVLLAALVLGSACATKPTRARRRVTELASERLDRPVAWDQGTPDDAKVRARVARLLAEPLTPESAVAIALVRNQRIQITLERLGVAQADLVAAGLLRNPHLGGGPRVPLNAGVLGYTFDAALAFLDALLIPLRRKLAKAHLNETILIVAHEVLTLDADVRKAYYGYVAAQQMLELQRSIAEATEVAAELAARQLAAGTTSELDAGLMASQYQGAKVELVHLQTEVAERREHLNRLLGVWGEDLGWSTRPALPELPAQEAELAQLEALGVANRLDLAARKVEVEAMVAAVELARRTPFVAADLGATGERDPGGQFTLGPFFELTVPVFNWGQADIRARRGDAAQVERRSRPSPSTSARRSARRGSTWSPSGALAEFQHDTILAQRARNIALAQERYDAMLLGVYDLLALKREEFDARRQLVEHLCEYLIARAELELAIGGRLEALLDRAAARNRRPARK